MAGMPLHLDVGPATADRFDDVGKVINPHGNPKHCWCLSYRLSPSELTAYDDDRATAMRGLCSRQPSPGVLAYHEAEPVGWCGLAPREDLSRLRSSRTIPKVDDRPAWSIFCFVVRSGYRRQGIGDALLSGAVAYAQEQGATCLEGYPVDPEGARMNTSLAYVGTTGMFERAGFSRVTETSSRSGGLTRWLMRLDLPGPAGLPGSAPVEGGSR
jgi:GNAT superfamily N-acetyltransferase